MLPGSVSRAVAETAGVVAGRLPAMTAGLAGAGLAARRAVVAANLRRVYGTVMSERRLAARVDDAFASYARYWAESLRLPSLSAAEVEAGTVTEGMDHVDEALAAGRGLIAALPHLGGWDWGGMFLAGRGYRASVVVEALQPPELFDWFVGYRRQLGLDVIPVGPDAAKACLRALHDNRILCLLADRVVPGVPGVGVELFGAPAMLPAGPVTLALRTGAPLITTAIYFGRRTDDHVASIRPPLEIPRLGGRLRADVAAGTALVARELEGLIRRAPTQWHVMQPVWAADGAGAGDRGRRGGP